jgi:hypothetical protein
LRRYVRYKLSRFHSFILFLCSFNERCFPVILYSLDGFTLFCWQRHTILSSISINILTAKMARSFVLSTALLALGVSAQTSSKFTDEKTGITFSGLHHSSGYRLGYALPEKATTDFIVQVQAPITNDGGWAGFSMVRWKQAMLWKSHTDKTRDNL